MRAPRAAAAARQAAAPHLEQRTHASASYQGTPAWFGATTCAPRLNVRAARARPREHGPTGRAAPQETERFALLLKRHALAPFAAPAGLAATAACCLLALVHCRALEASHGLTLAPRLMRDLWPACEQARSGSLLIASAPECPAEFLCSARAGSFYRPMTSEIRLDGLHDPLMALRLLPAAQRAQPLRAGAGAAAPPAARYGGR